MTGKPSWKNQFEKSFNRRMEGDSSSDDSWFPGCHFLTVMGGDNSIWSEVDEPVYSPAGVLAQSMLRSAGVQLSRHLRACESPIEEAMLVSLISTGLQLGDLVEVGGFTVGWDDGLSSAVKTLLVKPQFKVEKFRADFRVSLRKQPRGREESREASVLVECDGHDYHERTKDQARRDKSRDRKLQALGHQVLRFTGSEIWADPLLVASEVVDHLSGMLAAEAGE